MALCSGGLEILPKQEILDPSRGSEASIATGDASTVALHVEGIEKREGIGRRNPAASQNRKPAVLQLSRRKKQPTNAEVLSEVIAELQRQYPRIAELGCFDYQDSDGRTNRFLVHKNPHDAFLRKREGELTLGIEPTYQNKGTWNKSVES